MSIRAKTSFAPVWLAQLACEADNAAAFAKDRGLVLPPSGAIAARPDPPLPIAKAVAVVAVESGCVSSRSPARTLVLADWIADFDIAPRAASTEGLRIRSNIPTRARRKSRPHARGSADLRRQT
ncbi:hypothetical protein [uncultured Rhodoblastus sp.]|uniref:hypothetical protein n=1 Tax=uncultured Rhodoblastus sp. TaxID=543037 RepID=UPI0025D9095D|nr:hypothetical protein [uncultured Rhodoblastus sp.]